MPPASRRSPDPSDRGSDRVRGPPQASARRRTAADRHPRHADLGLLGGPRAEVNGDRAGAMRRSRTRPTTVCAQPPPERTATIGRHVAVVQWRCGSVLSGAQLLVLDARLRDEVPLLVPDVLDALYGRRRVAGLAESVPVAASSSSSSDLAFERDVPDDVDPDDFEPEASLPPRFSMLRCRAASRSTTSASSPDSGSCEVNASPPSSFAW